MLCICVYIYCVYVCIYIHTIYIHIYCYKAERDINIYISYIYTHTILNIIVNTGITII